MSQSFILKPFHPLPNHLDLSCHVEIVAENPTYFEVFFSVCGELSAIIFNHLSEQKIFKQHSGFENGLFNQTCFEVFYKNNAPKNAEYLEYNFTPTPYHAGNWAHYGFHDYRIFDESHLLLKNTKKPAFLGLHLMQNNKKTWGWRVYYSPFFIESHAHTANIAPLLTIIFNPTAIIKLKHQHQIIDTYWATHHLRPQADFHAPENFI